MAETKKTQPIDIGCRALLNAIIGYYPSKKFTADDIARLVLKAIGGTPNCTQRHIYRAARNKLRLLTQAGCLIAERMAGTGKQPFCYSFSPAALAVLAKAADESWTIDETQAYMATEFRVEEKSYIINGKLPSKCRKKRAGPTRSASAARGSGEIARGEVEVTWQDGNDRKRFTVAGAPEIVEEVISKFMRGGASAAELAPPDNEQPVDFRATLSILLTEHVAAMRATLAKLSHTASKNGKVAGLRYIALAMSQWTQVLAGIKYAIACEFIQATGAKPCNADDASVVAMSDDLLASFDSYLQELAQVAERLPTESGSTIELPTLHALSADGSGFAKTPCPFREANLIAWQAKGNLLPAALLEKLRNKRKLGALVD